MKRCVEQLRQLQNDIPSMTLYAARSRGAYLLLREKYEQAIEWLSEALKEEPLAVAGWARGHGALARAHNALGQYAQARDACRAALDKLTEADLSFPAMNLIVELELAVAEAGLGDLAGARERIAALLAKHGAGEGPLTLGAIHEAGLRIETLAADSERALSHLFHMERWYRKTGIPTLIERCERLSRAHRKAGGKGERSSLGLSGEANELAYRLRHGGGRTARGGSTAEWALSQVLEGREQDGGFILLTAPVTEREALHVAGDAPPEAVIDWARKRLQEEAEFETHTTLVSELAKVPARDTFACDGRAYRLAPLRAKLTTRTVTLGVLVVPSEQDVVPAFAPEVLRALADRLLETSASLSSSAPFVQSFDRN